MLTRSGVNEGMYKKQVPESILVNYTVESISDFLLKIEKLDGKVIKPNQEVIEIGWIATVKDLEGTCLHLFSKSEFNLLFLLPSLFSRMLQC